MQRISGLSLLLVGIILGSMALILGSQAVLRDERIARRQRQVQRDLEVYAAAGLLRNALVDDPRKRFVVPTSSVNYSGGRSIGEVLAEVSRFLAVEQEALERRLSFKEFVTHVAGTFLAGSRFAGRIQVNEPPREGFVNLYFLERDPRRLARHFDSNCSYIGYQAAIVCDARFIASYLARFDRLQKNYDVLIFEFTSGNTQNFEVSHQGNLDRVRSLLQQNFLTWIIGHEIGHAVLHERHVIRRNSDSHFDLRYSEIEKEADSFVAERVVGDPALGSQFYILIAEFLEQEFRQLYRQQHPSRKLTEIEDNFLTRQESVELEYSRYHVPLILRAVRVMERLRAVEPAIGSSGYLGKIGSHVVLVQSLAEGREESIVRNIAVRHPVQSPVRAPHLVALLALVGAAAVFSIIRLNARTQEER